MNVNQNDRVQFSKNQILKDQRAQDSKNQILKSEQYRSSTRNNKTKNKQKKGLKNFFNFVFYCFIIGFVTVLFLLYGPYNKFREWYITTAMTTMSHQYLATWFYSDETIAEVQANNKVVEVTGITKVDEINTSNQEDKYIINNEYDREIYEKDPNHPEYKIININGKKYSGYLAVVYDASQIHTMVTSKLKVSGQYITKMAENTKAKLAINGGFFVDLKEDRTGGTPLGITISNGKFITTSNYNGDGGLIGFDEDNKLVLGKLTVEQAKKMKIRDAVTAAPFLIINGKSSKVVGNGGWGTAPRTAIGQRKDGTVLMLVIDGRRVGKPGAEMNDLIEIMERYGAYNAAALDGGTSSVLVENYKIINDPIDSDGVHKTRPVATGFGVYFDE